MDSSLALQARIGFRDRLVLEIRRRAIVLCPDLRNVSPLAFRRKLTKRRFRVLLSILAEAWVAKLEDAA